MIRSLIFVGVLALGLVARAESTTITSCKANSGETVIEAAIGVSSEAANGVMIRQLMASTLSFGETSVNATELNCVRNEFCAHIGDAEELKISYRLYPHYKRNSGELRSITMTTSSSIMTDSMELTNCKVVDQYPQHP